MERNPRAGSIRPGGGAVKKPAAFLLYAFFVLALLGGFLLAAESYLRRLYPKGAFEVGRELGWMRRSRKDLARVFTVDPEFGFRPILGNDLYNSYGTINNGYRLPRPPGVTRLLFMGDSVTARGRIVEALRRIRGEKRFEYWNAGVESFNTTQEVNYYRKYNHRISPDHVILTFVYNDFGTTPITFFNRDKKLVVFALNRPRRRVIPWLFEHSYLYRFLLGKNLLSSGRAGVSLQKMGRGEVRRSLHTGNLVSRSGWA